MSDRNPAVIDLLVIMRQHPGFPDFLAVMETPQLPRFKKSEAANVEGARAAWIFASGRIEQHENWIAYLTGKGETK